MFSLEEHIAYKYLSEDISAFQMAEICEEYGVDSTLVEELALDIMNILENGLEEEDQVILSYAIKTNMLDESSSKFLLENFVDYNIFESVDSELILEGKILDKVKKHAKALALAGLVTAGTGTGYGIAASRDAYSDYSPHQQKAQQAYNEFQKQAHHLIPGSDATDAQNEHQNLMNAKKTANANLQQFAKDRTEFINQTENKIARKIFPHRAEVLGSEYNMKIPGKQKDDFATNAGTVTGNVVRGVGHVGTSLWNAAKSFAGAASSEPTQTTQDEKNIYKPLPGEHNKLVDRAQNQRQIAIEDYDNANKDKKENLQKAQNQASENLKDFENNQQKMKSLGDYKKANIAQQKYIDAEANRIAHLPPLHYRLFHVLDTHTVKPIQDAITGALSKIGEK